tara:strand:- start:292 stop:738 length:447 start_codon:yes stop_codon:yes gene_type:complete
MKVIIKEGNQELVVDEHQRLEINGNTVIVYLPIDDNIAPKVEEQGRFPSLKDWKPVITNQPEKKTRRRPTAVMPRTIRKSTKSMSNPKNLKRLIKKGVNIKELIDAGHSIHDIMAVLPNKTFKYRMDGTIDMRTFNVGKRKVFSSMVK